MRMPLFMQKPLLKLGLFVWLTLMSAIGSQQSVASDLQIVTLDVSSGDAALVIFPTGKTMMIDTGSDGKFTNNVMPFLELHGISHLDYFVNSHPHGDHLNGLPVMQASGLVDDNTVMWDWETFDYEDQFTLEGVDFFISNARDTSFHGTDANYNSLAFTMTYNDFVYSTGGDEGTKSVNRFLDDHPDKVRAHVRNTAHHMYGPISKSYLRAIDAHLYIISNTNELRDWNDWNQALNDFIPNVIGWLFNNGGRVQGEGYYFTGEVGHIYIRASSASNWDYTFLPTKTDMIPCWTTCIDVTVPIIKGNDGPNGSVDMVVVQK